MSLRLASVLLLSALFMGCSGGDKTPKDTTPDSGKPDQDTDTDADADADADADTDADSDADTDADTGILGSLGPRCQQTGTFPCQSWCSAGGAVSSADYYGRMCFGPLDVTSGQVSSGQGTWQAGPIYYLWPEP